MEYFHLKCKMQTAREVRAVTNGELVLVSPAGSCRGSAASAPPPSYLGHSSQ